jgi:dynein heavy chain
MENEKMFDGWFKVNVRPFKQALLNTVCKWGNLFKQHLVDHVVNRYEMLVTYMVTYFVIQFA